jgi:hypothetical protein
MMPYTVAGDVHRRGGCVEPRSRDVAEKTRGASSVSLVGFLMWSVSKQSSERAESPAARRSTWSQSLVFFMGLVLGDWVTGAGARPLRGRAPRMSRVQPARAYDALYGAWGTRATPSRPTRATPRAPRGRLTAHRSPHPPPNVAFSQTPCTPCPGRGTTTASRRAPPTPRRLCLCGRTCSPRAPTTRRMRRGASAPRPPNARFHHRSPLSRNLSRVHI